MEFQTWGEDQFIDYLKTQFPSCQQSIMGIGDDCAVIPMDNHPTKAWVVTTDALVEGVHFLKEEIPPHELGYKTVAVNVSDIAAMGAKPEYAFLSIALPKTIAKDWVIDLVKGIKEACRKWDVQLLGGDTVGSKRDVFLNLTLIGTAERNQIKFRNQAQSKDVICVTNYLGDSGGGLKALQTHIHKTASVQTLIHAHFHPSPILEHGLWLAKHVEVHAMMDISDGLQIDLTRLLKKSDKGARIELSHIPISSSLLQVSLQNEWDSFELALTGGEDYCLLLTIGEDAFDSIQKEFLITFGTPLFAIGTIDNSKQLIYLKEGKQIDPHFVNFNHFE